MDPALLGTRNVLETANRTRSVRRVVLTSSCAAIYGDVIDSREAPGGILTEDCWNTSSSLEHNPYPYSKVLAEKEAWQIAGAQSRWRLVVVNPSFVVGPAINPHGTSESFTIVCQFGNGAMKAGTPSIEMGVVDVRDLAEAHLRAAYLPRASGRHIVSARNSSLPELAAALLPEFDRYPLPRRTLPKWLVWLVAPLADKSSTRKFVSRNVGHPLRIDNSRSISEFGMTYRPFRETIQSMFQQLIDAGRIVPEGPICLPTSVPHSSESPFS